MKRTYSYMLIYFTYLISTIPIILMFFFLYHQKEGSGDIYDVIFNAVLFLSFGIFHSLFARNSFNQFITKFVGENYRTLIYSIFAGTHLSVVLYFWRPLTGYLWITDGFIYWGLTALFFISICGMFLTMYSIDYLSFIGIRNIYRNLSNKPSRNQVFSVKGLYAHCRHPLYLLLFIALWAGPLMTYTRLEFVILSSLYLIIGVFFEEKKLLHEFGNTYKLYKENVPMWIPKLKPWNYIRVVKQ